MAEPETSNERRRHDDTLKERVWKLALVLAVFMMAISTYGRFQAEWERDDTARRSQVATDERARAQDSLDVAQGKIDAQQRDLACFADGTTRWEVAISGVIVSSVREGATTPERQQQALEQLVKVNEELQRSKALCPAPTTTTSLPPR